MRASLPAPLVGELMMLPPADLEAVLSAFDASARGRIMLALEVARRQVPEPSPHSAWMASLLDDAAAVIAGSSGRLTMSAAQALIETHESPAPERDVPAPRVPGPSLLDGLKQIMPAVRTPRR